MREETMMRVLDIGTQVLVHGTPHLSNCQSPFVSLFLFAKIADLFLIIVFKVHPLLTKGTF